MRYVQFFSVVLILNLTLSISSHVDALSVRDEEKSTTHKFSENIEDQVQVNVVWRNLLRQRRQLKQQQQHQQQQHQSKQHQPKRKRFIKPNVNETFTKQEKRLRLLFHRCLEGCKHFWSQCQSSVADDNIQEGVVCFQASNICKEECMLNYQIRKKKLIQQDRVETN